ncbi:MAG: thioredoxin family protein [Ignavibacteriales bacterium]|nr:MAG: thioredoxin family protein [Ignavibacteriales bacterium]
MIIKILGMGCAKCNKLEEKVKEIAMDNNIEATFQKVTDIQEIMKYKIMMTPGLVINERVMSSGVIPKDELILQWLKEN